PVTMSALKSLPHREGFVFRPPAKRVRGEIVAPLRYTDLGRQGGGQIATAFGSACRRAGLSGRMMTNGRRPYFQPDLGPHDLRHTWASWQYAIHKDPLRLMVTGGWSSMTMIQRYTHLMPEAYVEPAKAWLTSSLQQILASAITVQPIEEAA
ncbi:MAG: integrase, partial [Rhodospirillales bacterium]|nr:integrase [Rhodospirillales bacterium]